MPRFKPYLYFETGFETSFNSMNNEWKSGQKLQKASFRDQQRMMQNIHKTFILLKKSVLASEPKGTITFSTEECCIY